MPLRFIFCFRHSSTDFFFVLITFALWDLTLSLLPTTYVSSQRLVTIYHSIIVLSFLLGSWFPPSWLATVSAFFSSLFWLNLSCTWVVSRPSDFLLLSCNMILSNSVAKWYPFWWQWNLYLYPNSPENDIQQFTVYLHLNIWQAFQAHSSETKFFPNLPFLSNNSIIYSLDQSRIIGVMFNSTNYSFNKHLIEHSLAPNMH